MRAVIKTYPEHIHRSALVEPYSPVEFTAGPKRLFMKDVGATIVYRFESGKQLGADGLRQAIQDICDLARTEKRSELIFSWSNIEAHAGSPKGAELAKLFGEVLMTGSYQFDTYKKDKNYPGITSIKVDQLPESLLESFNEGVVIGEAVTKACDLCNTPACHMRPLHLRAYGEELVDLAVEKVHERSFDPFKPYGDDKDNLGLVIGVGQGAMEGAEFIWLEYWGNVDSTDITLVNIGKGVCFDTGGLSMKSAEGMLGMHHDMGGAAAVLASLEALIRLKARVNVAVLVPAVENSVSECATYPGDILTSMSGLTVEVGNTDAEGRLILADALSFAGKYYPKAKLYMDAATLTGAAGVALGSSYSGLFTTNDTLATGLLNTGRVSGDPLWRLPIGGEFEKLLDSKVADLNNVQSGSSKNGGASIGASFLHRFAREAGIDERHAHIDIAPRMKGKDGLSQGAGTRLFIETALEFARLA